MKVHGNREAILIKYTENKNPKIDGAIVVGQLRAL